MLQTFLRTDSGGANVDWVLITALMVALGLSVMSVMTTGLDAISQELARVLAAL